MLPRPAATALGIDFGTSHTIAVVRRADGSVRPLLFDGSPLMPSAVCADAQGGLLVGRDALHGGRRHPERFEPNPKRHIDRATVLLADREFPLVETVAAVLRAVADECRRVVGPPQQVTVTVPAEWGPARRRVVEDAAVRSGLGAVRLVPEPVAAATYFAKALGHHVAAGSSIVVYDLGAGTFDASVVRRTAHGFTTVALDGRGDLGGLDIDAAVVEHLAATYGDHEGWRRLVDPATAEERRWFREFQEEIRGAKERLSRHQQADLAIPLLDVEAHLTRTELEQIAAPLLERTVDVTRSVVRAAGLDVARSAGVFLVGGASRMPLVATMLHRALGLPPTVLDQPEVVVAEGSVLWTGPPLPAAPPQPPAPRPVTPQPQYRPQRTPPAPQAAPASPQRSLPPSPPGDGEQAPPPSPEDRAKARRIGRKVVIGVIIVDILIVIALVVVFRPDAGADHAPDGDALAIMDESLESGTRFDQLGGDLQAHDGAVTAVLPVATDDRTVLFTSGADGSVRQWDAATGDLIESRDFEHDVNSLALMDFSDGPRVVALDGDLGVHAWDPVSFAVETLIESDMTATTPERIMPCTVDGHAAFAVATADGYGLFDLETLGVIAELEYTEEQRDAYRHFALVDGEATLVTAHADGSLRLFDAATGEAGGGPLGPGPSAWDGETDVVGALRTVHTGATAYAMTYSNEGAYYLWDLDARRFAGVSGAFGDPKAGYLRTTLVLGGDDFLLTYGEDEARLHSFPEGAADGVLRSSADSPVSAAATAPVDRYTIAVTGSEDGVIRVWNMGD
ncbi:MAG TPA: Hsp70 family protein [Glycomyces sp.]|nr:Hsp70 family protein [Glycomyces sp.]